MPMRSATAVAMPRLPLAGTDGVSSAWRNSALVVEQIDEGGEVAFDLAGVGVAGVTSSRALA